jgi:hypothetical protein
MPDKKDVTRVPSATASPRSMIDSFLGEAKRVVPIDDVNSSPRLIVALDATMSRQPTWDLACKVQGEMFDTASRLGGLAVQLVYFRGFNECRASRWVADARALQGLMTRIDCRGGQTQICRVLRHVARETAETPVKVLVYVGDAMEEPIDDVCASAGELALLGVKGFMFHEGSDASAATAFREVARLTGGAYAHFDGSAPRSLAELLKAAAIYASGGLAELRQLAADNAQARRLLTAMTGPTA